VLASTAPVCPLTVLAWRLEALSLTDLWWRYAGMGGNHRQSSLGAYLAGTAEWTPTEHNVLAHALNENLWAVGCPSLAPYRDREDLGPGTRAQLPLDVPVQHLDRPG
jgi:hypothetical protein